MTVEVSRPDWAELPFGDHVLAEGPRWDPRRRRLSWVDILSGTVSWSTWHHDGWGAATRHRVGRMPTAAEPLPDRDGWAIAVDGAIRVLDADGGLGPAVPVSPDFPEVRTNDMIAAPGGRLVVGLLTEDRVSARGGLVSVELGSGRTTVLADGYIAANGLAVAADEQTLYAVDTGRGTISRHALDGGGESAVVVSHTGPGVFDGIVLGPEGDLWVAVWGAGEVHRYSTKGVLQQVLRTPVAQPSALALVDVGGLPRLVLTTARADQTPKRRLTPDAEGRLYWATLPEGR
ncbi:SMP-30/gluconolactonase/LRE family protein [Knoellia locipacati]|uniref:SMP-30/gluconolactonase/LRE family protein n=1 Tax=Knoellia locipacati TaxID=882824 RepID=UPI003851525F